MTAAFVMANDQGTNLDILLLCEVHDHLFSPGILLRWITLSIKLMNTFEHLDDLITHNNKWSKLMSYTLVTIQN